MNTVRVTQKLYWDCPKCKKRHGLKNLPEVEAIYINGPLNKVVKCRGCGVEFTLEPAWRELK